MIGLSWRFVWLAGTATAQIVSVSPIRAKSFFFSGYGDHRDLHSFPTRRSSDLIEPKLCKNARISHDHRAGVDRLRSEEHTSELQSHVNLVCRLLLEKKKS